MNHLAINPETEVPQNASPPLIEMAEFVDERFRVGEIIADGPQSTVYKAIDYDTGNDVAIKVPLTGGDEPAQRALREAILTEAFSSEHTDVLKFAASNITETKEERPFLYIATEFMEAGSLKDMAKMMKLGIVPVNQVVKSTSGPFEVVAAMHSAELLHRDLKPGNIVRDSEGKGKLADFGNAGAQSIEPEALDYYHISPNAVSESLTSTGSYHGTAGFIAPEAVKGAGFDKKTDVFAAGATVHRLLTGKLLPHSPDQRSVNRLGSLNRALVEYAELYDTPFLHEIPDHVPAELGMLTLSAVERDPAFRPTMDEYSKGISRAAAQYN